MKSSVFVGNSYVSDHILCSMPPVTGTPHTGLESLAEVVHTFSTEFMRQDVQSR